MAMTKCVDCGHQVSTKAEACPRCGAKQRKSWGCLTVVFVAFGVVILLLFVRVDTGSDGIKTVDASNPLNQKRQSEHSLREQVPSPPLEAPVEAKGTTYTPKKLKAMIAAGKYPSQGTPTTQSEEMEFADCVAKMREVVEAIGSSYPTETIANTAILRMQKIWTNDAAVTVSCSAPDGKLVMTSAKYR